jgi:hypothetical protein
MTEVNPKRKMLPGLLLRIFAFIIVGLLVWMTYEFFTRGTQPAQDVSSRTIALDPVPSLNVPAQVSEFSSFIQDNPSQERMGLDHAYTSDSIRRLADAIGAIADLWGITHPDIKDKLNLLRSHADRLQEDRRSTNHANIVRDAFTHASDLVASIERQITQELGNEVADVYRAAEALDPDERVLDQKVEVEMFFKKTSLLLNKMAQHKS